MNLKRGKSIKLFKKVERFRKLNKGIAKITMLHENKEKSIKLRKNGTKLTKLHLKKAK